MNINLDKNACRSVLMDLWEQCQRDYNFVDSPKGGIYDLSDDIVQMWIIQILEGNAVMSHIIDINIYEKYQPCIIEI